MSADESAKVFRDLINDRNAGTLLYKLRSQEDQMSAESAARLIEVLARNGGCFPSPDSFVFFMQPLMQAVICVRQLMRRIPAEERASIAIGVMADAETLKFACDAARWLGLAMVRSRRSSPTRKKSKCKPPSERGSNCISRRNPKRSGYSNPRMPEPT